MGVLQMFAECRRMVDNTTVATLVVTKINPNVEIPVCLFKSTVVTWFNHRRLTRKQPERL